VCLNTGEEYTPQAIEPYVARCSLHLRYPDGHDEELVARGRLNVARLVQPQRRMPLDSAVYMNFVDPLDLKELTRVRVLEGVERLKGRHESFRPGIGRLARLGYGSRLVAAIFSLTLFLRGRVPGDTAAAASLATRQIREYDDRHVYYGRVIHDRSGWTVLQYWYFYSFDNWRSGFYGANDHEADWEMATIYLYQRGEEYVPSWVAYSCHDYAGAELRRRWDDAGELTLSGEHPLLYVGIGSHAGYFRAGDYLAEIEVPLFGPLARTIDLLRQFWVGTLRQAGVTARVSRLRLFRVPFVDYARGDGLRVGPAQDADWSPVLLDPLPDWIDQYRGLWGYNARDPLDGEDAPAGPAFNRDGSPRRSWANPLGWAELEGVPTPDAEPELLERRRLELEEHQRELDVALENGLAELERIGVDLAALAARPHVADAYQELVEERAGHQRRSTGIRRDQVECSALLEAIADRQVLLAQGVQDPPRAHLDRVVAPVPEPDYRLRWLVELWSAVSITVLVAAVLALFFLDRALLIPHLLMLLFGFLIIDAVLRRQVRTVVSGLGVTLAVVSALILLKDLFLYIVVGALITAVLYLAWTNIREVFR